MLGYLLHLEVLVQKNSKHLENFYFCMIYLMCFSALLWSYLLQTTILELCSINRENCGDLYLQISKQAASNSQHALARLFRLEMGKTTLCSISARIHTGLIYSLRSHKKAGVRLTELSRAGNFWTNKKLRQEEKNYSSLHKFVLIFHPLSIGGKQMVSRC